MYTKLPEREIFCPPLTTPEEMLDAAEHVGYAFTDAEACARFVVAMGAFVWTRIRRGGHAIVAEVRDGCLDASGRDR